MNSTLCGVHVWYLFAWHVYGVCSVCVCVWCSWYVVFRMCVMCGLYMLVIFSLTKTHFAAEYNIHDLFVYVPWKCFIFNRISHIPFIDFYFLTCSTTESWRMPKNETIPRYLDQPTAPCQQTRSSVPSLNQS